MSKQTDLINIPDAITVDGSKVGIGTSSPQQMLDIDLAQASETILRVGNTSTSAGSGAKITAEGSSNKSIDVGIRSINDSAYGALDAESGFIWYDGATSLVLGATNSAGIIKFNTGGLAERMRIDASGNVGIGAAPSTHLTAGYNLRLDGGAQTYLAFNNDTHTTQVLGGFVIGNDNSAARITQRENQPIIFATNDTTRMTIDNLGRVTTPSQPAFMARLDTSFTVGPNPTTLPAGTAVYNIGGHYSTGTYRFTAPVAGRYLFASNIQYQNNGGSHIALYVNNSASFAGQGWVDFGTTTGATQTMIHNLAAGDYVEAKIYHTISNTPVSTGRTKWMGYLIG
jgi:hypothetical protein